MPDRGRAGSKDGRGDGSAPSARDAAEIARDLDRLREEAEARGHDALAYLINIAVLEARRLAEQA